MKSSIFSIEKWYDIKKKFRSSYLFVLRFGGDCELPFIHTPIQMVKNNNSILTGKYDCKTQT